MSEEKNSLSFEEEEALEALRLQEEGIQPEDVELQEILKLQEQEYYEQELELLNIISEPEDIVQPQPYTPPLLFKDVKPEDVLNYHEILSNGHPSIDNLQSLMPNFTGLTARADQLTTLVNNLFLVTTFKDTQEILIYDVTEGIWKNEGDLIIANLCRLVNRDVSGQVVNEVKNRIKDTKYKERFEFNPKKYVAVNNGVINLQDFSFIPHSREHFITKKINHDYNPFATCPKIEKFIGELVNPKDVRLLEEILGFTLYTEYNIKKFFLLQGLTSSGKSTFLNLITRFLGQENVSGLSLHQFNEDSFEIANLYGKFANICSDISSKEIEDESLIKRATGNDLISAMQKYSKSIQFYNNAKMIFSCNNLPAFVNDQDLAIFNRLITVQFPNQFLGDNANKNILKEICTPEEMSGLLNIAISGLKRLLERGYFENVETVESIKEKRRKHLVTTNPIKSYIEFCLDPNSLSGIPKVNMDRGFYNWQALNQVQNPVTKAKFTRYFPSMMFGVHLGRKTINGSRVKYWYGVGFKDEWKFLGDKQTPDE